MIQINEKIRIVRFDKLNLQLEVLGDVTNPQTKEVRKEWKPNGYYGDLKSAIGGALKYLLMELTTEEISTLSLLIERIDNIDKELKGAIENVRNEN